MSKPQDQPVTRGFVDRHVGPSHQDVEDMLKTLGVKYLFVDSRPGPMFAEGRIPGAVSLPYAVFKEKAASLLPADKGTLVVFYCAGET